MKVLILAALMILPTQAYAGVTACGGEAAACGGSVASHGHLFAGVRARHAARVDRRVQRRASRLACGGLSTSASCAGSTTTGCGGSAVVTVQTVTVAAAPCDATCESTVVLGVEAPRLPLVANSSSRNVGRFQQEAEWEAQQMASRGIKNHIRGVIPGVGFAGVGWSSGGTPSTCTPGRGGTCVADAIARGSDGLYRCRYYR